ncbi:MAG: hypothetical protein SGI83_03560 [Bacteroidota bacterium]|nr:hypothetical protein [Bacteroidota bacterium]
MKRFSHIFFLAALTLVIFSCSKGGDPADDGGGGPHVVTPDDVTPPVITITTPTINQVFLNGSTISITGKLTDDYGLYRGTIRVINDANGAVIVNQAYEIHGLLLYNFSLNHTASVAGVTDYTVTVAFEDHGNNIASKSIKLKVNP